MPLLWSLLPCQIVFTYKHGTPNGVYIYLELDLLFDCPKTYSESLSKLKQSADRETLDRVLNTVYNGVERVLLDLIVRNVMSSTL